MHLAATWDFLMKGGPMMIPIMVVSLICIALIIERYFALRTQNILPHALLQAVYHAKGMEGIQTLQAVSKVQASPLSNVVQATLEARSLEESFFKDEVERVGKREALNLEKNLVYLGILAALGPLLGLFGTVTGMISTFQAVKELGVGNPQQLSGGISEALLCTAGGMIIGMPALIFHRYFLHKVDKMILQLEDAISKVVRLVRVGA